MKALFLGTVLAAAGYLAAFHHPPLAAWINERWGLLTEGSQTGCGGLSARIASLERALADQTAPKRSAPPAFGEEQTLAVAPASSNVSNVRFASGNRVRADSHSSAARLHPRLHPRPKPGRKSFRRS